MKMRIAGAALLLAIAAPLQAQHVEAALRAKDELKLTPAQVTQLEAIRKEIVAERQQQANNMIDVRSRLEAGLVKREDLRKEFESKREAFRKNAEARHDRLMKIFTDEQKDLIHRHMERAAMQQRRMQGGRGMGQGFRGEGFRGQRAGRGRGMMRPGMPGMRGQGFGEEGMRPRRPMPPRPPRFDDEDEDQI